MILIKVRLGFGYRYIVLSLVSGVCGVSGDDETTLETGTMKLYTIAAAGGGNK